MVEQFLKGYGGKVVGHNVGEGHGQGDQDGERAEPGGDVGRGASHSPWADSDPRSSHWNYASFRPLGPKKGVQMRIQF